MSIAGLDHDKKVCFWLNIYHTLTLHAILVKGFPQGPLDRLNFHKSQLYQIGKHRYCLLDIEHAVLRNAMEQPETGIPFFSFPRFSDSDPRKVCSSPQSPKANIDGNSFFCLSVCVFLFP